MPSFLREQNQKEKNCTEVYGSSQISIPPAKLPANIDRNGLGGGSFLLLLSCPELCVGCAAMVRRLAFRTARTDLTQKRTSSQVISLSDSAPEVDSQQREKRSGHERREGSTGCVGEVVGKKMKYPCCVIARTLGARYRGGAIAAELRRGRCRIAYFACAMLRLCLCL